MYVESAIFVSGENAWSRPSSTEIFEAVPHGNKEMVVLPVASQAIMSISELLR